MPGLSEALACKNRYYRVERRDISYIKFIFEAYDGIAFLKTVDAAHGIIMLMISPGCEKIVELLIEDLSRNIRIEPADAG